MSFLYISLAEILVFSDAYCFFENIANMKKSRKLAGNQMFVIS